MNKQGLPQGGLNGGVPIGQISSPYVSGQHTEFNTLLRAFGDQSNNVFLGMLRLWRQFDALPTPLLDLTELSGPEAVIYTNGMGSKIEFGVPYDMPMPFVKAKIVDGMIDKPGIGNSYVPLVLSEGIYTNGDFLTNDKRNGTEVRIHPTIPVEPFGKGDSFLYLVTPSSGDPEDYIPHEVLEPGTRWCKIDNRAGEFDTIESSITNPERKGVMLMSHTTGNSTINISHSITSYADFSNIQSMSSGSTIKNVFDYTNENISNADRNALINFGKYEGGKMKGIGWAPYIFPKMVMELAIMKEHAMTWAKSGAWIGSNGKRVTRPKGYYQWIKQHGSYYTYNTLRQLPNIIKNAMADMFANSKIPASQRRAKFRLGTAAFIELQKYMRQQFKIDNPFLIVNDGKNPQLNGILTGSFDSLAFKTPRFVSYEFPEVGQLDIEIDVALDYIDNSNDIKHYDAGYYPNSSYMIFIEDVTSANFTNMKPRNAEYNVAGSYDNGTNVVQVKPRGFYDTVSFKIGKGCNPSLKAFAGQNPNSQIVSSDSNGFQISMQTTAEIFVKDASRIMLIEYVPSKY